MIALLDYGSGNLRSVHKALVKVGADVKIITGPDELSKSSAAVLPGVGAFDDCMHALQKQELLEATRRFIVAGKPFLGICVGYQALFERSEEFQSRMPGLGIFAGSVVRFVETPGLKIPQIGWNELEQIEAGCPLFRGMPEKSFAYFVHSFYPKPDDSTIIASRTTYGGQTFASAIWRDNIYATQFHPEKSQKVGLQLLRNFVEVAQNGEDRSLGRTAGIVG